MNAFLYSLGWFGSVYLAGQQKPFLAALTGCFFLLIIFGLERFKKSALFWVDFYLALYALGIGWGLEMIFINAGFIDYNGGFFPPLWIVLLYPLFSTTFNYSLEWLLKPYYGPILIGLLAPLSYYGGQKMGACVLPKETIMTYLFLSLGWILALFLLKQLNDSLNGINRDIEETAKAGKACMLFDGNCPYCSIEVNLLKKSPGKSQIDFVDIATDDYDPENFNLSYSEAMKELYAVDAKGINKKGVAAFYEIYARAGWKGLAFLTKAPGFDSLMRAGYKVFSRYRLNLPHF